MIYKIFWSTCIWLLKKHFRIEASKWGVKITYVENGCNSSMCLKGWGADVLHMMQKEMNFTYTIVNQDDAVGRKQADGSYTGIIGKKLK